MTRELFQESAGSLARMIRSGETSARAVAEAHLARIEAVNGAVNAVVEVRPNEVLAAADAADQHIAAGHPVGPLHGVPFTVKVNIDVTGYATTEGTAALADRIAPSDSPTVERMRAAGGVMLARTNMPARSSRRLGSSERAIPPTPATVPASCPPPCLDSVRG